MSILSWTESYGDELFRNFNLSKLGQDQAYLNITSDFPQPLYLYSVYKECHQCPYTKERMIENGDVLTISTRWEKLQRVLIENIQTSHPLSNVRVLCSFDGNFGEFGVYNLRVSNATCSIETLKEAVNIYFPILTVALIYAALIILATSCVYVWKVYTKKIERQTTSFDVDPKGTKQNTRVSSLDTFRGISITLMILVNFGCGGYEIFDHAAWNGLHLADVVFPWFMWIMGVCIPISTYSLAKKCIPKKTALKNILKRSCILFLMGLFLNSGTNLESLRVFAVLQRFGVCYFIVASTFVVFPNGLELRDDLDVEKKDFAVLKDILALKCQWLVALLILALHNLLTFLLHAPDCARGYLGPGGMHENGAHVGCTGGAAGYIDKLILGKHIYQHSVIRDIYKADAFEVEGILGCLTSAVQVFIGSQAGAVILFYKAHTSRLLRWVYWGAGLGLAGGLLCGFSKEDGLIPVNKHLWSLSFVMVTSSFAFFLLAICYVLMDVTKYWSGKPFLFAGMNAIFMYVGHSLAASNFPIRWVPNGGLTTHFLMLIENIWGVGVWLLIAYLLYRKKFFWSI